MTRFLMFRLYGAMASWGDVAPGEVRSSWSAPSRSAVLGLVAAALGVDRARDDDHAALHAGYGFATELRRPGLPLEDYHTAQTPEGRGPWITRAHELEHAKIKTILSDRSYYTEQDAAVALWAKADAPHALESLSKALRRPHYVLYLGRKSCPPALPLAPEIVEGDGLLDAFAAYQPDFPLPSPARSLAAPRVFADADAPGLPQTGVTRGARRDRVVLRSAWRFEIRAEIETVGKAPS